MYQADFAILWNEQKAGNSPGIGVGIEIVLIAQIYQTIARPDLTPAGRFVIGIQKIPVVLTGFEKIFPANLIFLGGAEAPGFPGRGPPGNTKAPAGLILLTMDSIEIIDVIFIQRDYFKLHLSPFPNSIPVIGNILFYPNTINNK